MGITDVVEDLADDVLEFGSAVASGAAGVAVGIADAMQSGITRMGEGGFAEAGGHIYVEGASEISKLNPFSLPLDPVLKEELRETFGALVDEIRITYEATLWELKVGLFKITESNGQTFGHRVYIKRPKLEPDHPEYEDQLELIAHELVHSRQYDEAGKSLLLFGNRYFRSLYKAKLVYRMNPMEIEARAVAGCLMRRRKRLAGIVGVHRTKWTPGWTHFVPFVSQGVPHYLAYKAEAGLAAIDRIKPFANGVEELARLQWSPGWTSFVPYFIVDDGTWIKPRPPSEVPHLLSYKASSGEVAIDTLQPNGRVQNRWRSKWTPGWTHMFGFRMEGRSCLFSYRAATGEAAIDRIAITNDGTETLWRSGPGEYAKDWTTFFPLTLDGAEPHYFAYKAVTGEFFIHRIKTELDGVEEIKRGKLNPGFSSLMPYRRRGNEPNHFLMYRSATGSVALLRIRSSLMPEIIWCHKWSKGWTSFMPFELEGEPHYLAYKAGSGDAAIDKISGPKAPPPLKPK
jgi:hypothetical protein